MLLWNCWENEWSWSKKKKEREDSPWKLHLSRSTFTLALKSQEPVKLECNAVQTILDNKTKSGIYVWRIRVGFLVSFAPHESSSSLRFYFLRPLLTPLLSRARSRLSRRHFKDEVCGSFNENSNHSHRFFCVDSFSHLWQSTMMQKKNDFLFRIIWVHNSVTI